MQSAYLAYIGGVITLSVQLVIFLRWMHRRMRDDEIARAFIKDMALVQLPWIHRALRANADAGGVEIEDPPPIQYIELNGRPKFGREFGSDYRNRNHW